MPELTHRVVIVGAGIGGLTAALALARRGHTITILEREAVLSAAGAGIQLSPNAMRILDGLGLGPALAGCAVEPENLVLYNGVTCARLCHMRLAEAARHRYGAPYLVAHRAALQSVLLSAVEDEPSIQLRFGCPFDGFSAPDGGDVVVRAGNDAVAGSVLIGADGLRSKVRDILIDPRPPRFTGQRAWRSVVPVSDLEPPFSRREVGAWLGPGTHIVHYPIRDPETGALATNIVMVEPSRHAIDNWDSAGDETDLRRAFSRWPAKIRHLIDAGSGRWRCWSLFDRAPDKRWGHGPATLIGDAAHPMLPFLAQGGAMAIEDAAVLAACLSRPGEPAAALRAFERQRMTRTAGVQAAARRNGSVFHLSGPFALARNTTLALMPQQALETRFDWLYGYRADGDPHR